MRRAVRAIIIKDDRLLIMHRNKFGTEYETLPGGNVEMGESLEQALIREISEETTVKFKNPRLVFLDHAGAPYGDQYVYLCEYVEGEPALQEHSEEALIHKMGANLYEPCWLSLQELSTKPFRSERLKQALLEATAGKWPEKVVEIN